MSFFESDPPLPEWASDTFADGNVVFGKFKVVRAVGEGAWGKVFECRGTNAPFETVALKVLQLSLTKQERAEIRFRNELHASYRVSHSNVVRGKEFFRSEDYLAFTMEFIGGESLGARLKAVGHLPWREVRNALLEICEGLSAIHAAGVMHGDLKPQNILMNHDKRLKITDFSAARFLNPPPGFDSREVIGTLNYMSPESLVAGEIDGRSDIFSLGVLGYEILTGRVPFSAHSSRESVEMKRTVRPLHPSEIFPEVPRSLGDALLKAVAGKSDQRFRTADEFAEALRKVHVFDRSNIRTESSMVRIRKRTMKVCALAAASISIIVLLYTIWTNPYLFTKQALHLLFTPEQEATIVIN